MNPRRLSLTDTLDNCPPPVSLAMTSLFASRGALAFTPSIARATRRGTVRTFTTTPSKPSSDDGDGDSKAPFTFPRGPAPPRLPKEEQEIFEDLQRKSTGAFTTPKVNQSPASEDAKSQGTLHPDAVMGVKAEFEGDQNPKTGEVGGPKNEPLRWGADGDWSYSGRVTDF